MKIEKNVLIVEGNAKDCIYNLNTGKMYHIGKKITEYIKEVTMKDFSTEENDDIEKILNYLLEEKIVTKEEQTDTILENGEKKIEFAWIEICDYCNLQCVHCYNESSPQKKNFMTSNEFLELCKKLKEYGIKRIQLIGGEPFCNPDVEEIIKIASGNFEFVEVFTNGTLLSDKICDLLYENGINVALSIYSYDEDQHDLVTRMKGSQSKTIQAIERLKNLGIKYRIATIHMKSVCIGNKNTDLFTLNEKKMS